MKITIENGHLYLGNLYFSKAEAGNGKSHLPNGKYPVKICKRAGIDTVFAEGVGHLGGSSAHDIVIGGVRSRSKLLADPLTAVRLVKSVERHLETGSVSLEIC
jgi:hypothetical protein